MFVFRPAELTVSANKTRCGKVPHPPSQIALHTACGYFESAKKYLTSVEPLWQQHRLTEAENLGINLTTAAEERHRLATLRRTEYEPGCFLGTTEGVVGLSARALLSRFGPIRRRPDDAFGCVEEDFRCRSGKAAKRGQLVDARCGDK